MPRFRINFHGYGNAILSKLSFENIQIIPEDKGNFRIEKIIEEDSLDLASSIGEEWAILFSQALSLLTESIVTIKVTGVSQLDGFVGYGPSMSRKITVTYLPSPKQICVSELKQVLTFIPKLEALSESDLRKRAVHWYMKGMKDSDFVDRFISHWIALEALSNLYEGDVEPYTCPNQDCKHILHPRPHGSVLRSFLKSLGLKNVSNDIKQMSNIRGDLFHKGKRLKEATSSQPILQEILKQSILKTMNP